MIIPFENTIFNVILSNKGKLGVIYKKNDSTYIDKYGSINLDHKHTIHDHGYYSSIYFENEKVGTDYVNQSIKGKTMGPLYY